MATNLVMGLWGRLPFPALSAFVVSLRTCGYDGEVLLFTYDLDADTEAFLARHGIRREDATPFLEPGLDVQTARYLMYRAYLDRAAHRHAHVMLTDTRDVLFQSDPFARPLASPLVFAAERILFRDCHMNSYWLRKAYGEAVRDEFRPLRVSCSGTSFGEAEPVRAYVAAMCAAIGERLDAPRRAIKGIDQGVHNFVIREPSLPGASLDAEDRLVATMHHLQEAAVAVADGALTIDGHRTPVVHQWDRHPVTAAFVAGAAHLRPA